MLESLAISERLRDRYVPELGKMRLAVQEDAVKIHELVNESMAANFRISKSSDIQTLIKSCVLSVCQLNENDHLVGFLALQDFPLMPSISEAAWESYIWTKYKSVELTTRNTLFIHLLCWSPSYGRELVDNMLRSVFMQDLHLQYIAMVKSLPEMLDLMPGQHRSEAAFKRVQVMERGLSGDRLPSLQIAERNEICLRMRIRRAVEEDNDDLLPILERRSKRMRDLYGEFYISELISRHPESERVILVCEYKEVAVGVMCLNTQINYEALEESFDLTPFAGLRHLEEIQRNKDIESTISLLGLQNNAHLISEPNEVSGEPPLDLLEAKSTTIQEEEDRDSIVRKIQEKELSSQISHLSTKAQLDIMNLLDDDEEELEFDIVNIDTCLLRMPRLISYEEISKSKIGGGDNLSKILDDRRKDSFSFEDSKGSKKERAKKSPSSAPPSKSPEPTRYSGPPNAILIELFAMHQDYDERFGYHLLEAAFETFPGRDYAIICLPSDEPSFPLLEHFTLVAPHNVRGRFVNDSLFVAHVNSVKGEVSVRLAEEYDVQYLTDVLEHAPRQNELLELIESSFSTDTLDTYVLLSRNQPVGVVILAPVEDSISVRVQYALQPEPDRPGTDGNVLVGILSPALEPHSRWYMRDVLRQSHYTQLFWTCRLFAKGDANPVRNLMSMASHMAPVLPYRHVPFVPEHDKDKAYKESSAPFALWTLDRPMTSLPKIYINKSIVVVGASRTGLSFLETLIMGPTSPYLTFTNLTLLSEHGLPTVGECLRAADTCVPRDGRYTDRYIKSVPYYFYLDVVPGVMVRIDRQKKCIYLKGGVVKYYDELVLTCGQQFQHPDYLKELLERDRVSKEKDKGCIRLLMDNPRYQPDRVPPPPSIPENMMLINSLFDANTALRKLLRMITESKHMFNALNEENKIVVYGDCIDAYSCIAALLELGIAADMITFVEPFPSEDGNALRVNCFNNETVDERVQLSLSELGIQVYRRYYFNGWKLLGSRIEFLYFMTHMQAITLPCFAFFYYGIKAIDVHSFKAITECGLVYDGGLVVGTGFETNDPNVHAAGTCTTYSRRLYARVHAQRHYCSEDVGEALAALFLQKLDPFLGDSEDDELYPSEGVSRYSSSFLGIKSSLYGSFSSESRFQMPTTKRWQPIMKFHSPITFSATMPGPLYYFKQRKPGIEIPMAVQLSLPLQGHTLITDKNGNYFRLQLNALHCVDSVCCLSKDPFPSDNLGQLYGKHEAFFDKLLVRYELKLIDDLYEFFAQPWMFAMYQTSFKNLLDDINDQDVGTIHDLLRSRFVLYDKNGKPVESQICSCRLDKTEAPDLGTFRSVIEKFVGRTSIERAQQSANVPSECGQSATVRDDAMAFWKAVGGKRIVVAHLARFLQQNYASNPQYSLPKPEFC
ncbi:cilia- and flagella-associated protein 61-like [Battus philenor]|uniref:cilia- and flagella-associated protein 61-like n=1 Tax=Battus philenor TaxID=42288 RepID=UPI0035CFE42E